MPLRGSDRRSDRDLVARRYVGSRQLVTTAEVLAAAEAAHSDA